LCPASSQLQQVPSQQGRAVPRSAGTLRRVQQLAGAAQLQHATWQNNGQTERYSSSSSSSSSVLQRRVRRRG
jgi:hypothetical protein